MRRSAAGADPPSRRGGEAPPTNFLWEELQIQTEDLLRAHARAKQALDRYRALFEDSPVGYLTLDPSGRVVEGNEAATLLLGSGDLVDLVHEDDRPILEGHLRVVFRDLEHTACRIRIATRGGEERLVKLDSAPIPGVRDRARCVLSAASSPSVAEQQLEQASALLDRTEGVLDLDPAGRVRWVSGSTEALFRAGSSDLVGRTLADLVDGAGLKRLQAGLTEAYAEEVEAAGIAQRVDGTSFPAEFRLCSSEQLGRNGTMLIVRDRSVEHELQVELRGAQRVEALGRVASSVLFDVQNLLSGVLAATEVSLQLLGNRNAARVPMRLIRQATQTAVELSGLVLTLGRSGQTATRPVVVDDQLRRLAPVLQRLPKADVDVVIRPGAPGRQVTLDDGALAQIVLNLITNALDATRGGGSIEVHTTVDPTELPEPLDPQIRWLVLEVSDDGTGIDAEALPKLFDPFFTTKADAPGAGLGLATVRGIVRQAGGDLEVQSDVGVGTRFRIYLPSEEHAVTGAASSQEASSPGAQGIVDQRAWTVLAVESNPLSLLGLEHSLREAGHRVLGAGSPAEARWLVELAGDEIEVAVIDLEVEGGGESLAEALRNVRPGLPVVYTSADPRPGVVDGHRVLSRPARRDRLHAAIRAQLG